MNKRLFSFVVWKCLNKSKSKVNLQTKYQKGKKGRNKFMTLNPLYFLLGHVYF